ncbi:MAG: helix-turn-helix domain-containing protein [Kiritimatiellaeota bacterium]|nr:helix-turn-helix domain-containing protein [Kiritimatiellota bacterium]
MPSLGPQLKAGRERKGVTASQAAAATRMKVQTIEALEREDFARIPAPMYVKGFIKIYAEYLGLDPAPLLLDYQQRHAPQEQPRPAADEVLRSPSGAKVLALKADAQKRAAALAVLLKRIPPPLMRRAPFAAGVLVLLILAIVGLRHCARRPPEPARPASVPPPATGLPWVVVQEPPEPYLKRAK